MYYVQNIYTDEERSFNTLKKAATYAVAQDDTRNIIHIGKYNLEYYEIGDTVESLYNKCKATETEILKKLGLKA